MPAMLPPFGRRPRLFDAEGQQKLGQKVGHAPRRLYRPATMLGLARAQFALTIMFHYLFPPLSIGLGAMMVMMLSLIHI